MTLQFALTVFTRLWHQIAAVRSYQLLSYLTVRSPILTYQFLQHFSIRSPRSDPISYCLTYYQIADLMLSLSLLLREEEMKPASKGIEDADIEEIYECRHVASLPTSSIPKNMITSQSYIYHLFSLLSFQVQPKNYFYFNFIGTSPSCCSPNLNTALTKHNDAQAIYDATIQVNMINSVKTLRTQNISAPSDWCRNIRTVPHQCRSVSRTLRHWCGTVSTCSKHFCYNTLYKRKV